MESLLKTKSIYKKYILKISAISIVVLLPLNLIFFYNYVFLKSEDLKDKRKTLEEIILYTLTEQSQYGDIVYSRAKAIETGRKLGLIDIGLCIDGNDIFEKPNDIRCKKINQADEELTTQNTTLAGKQFKIEFRWHQSKLPMLKIFLMSTVTSFLLVFIAIIPLLFFLLKNLLKEISIETKKILDNQLLDHNSIDSTVSSEEFKPIAILISEMSNKLKQMTRDKLYVEIARKVSHDIRSPLASLNSFIENVIIANNEESVLLKKAITRINNIADSFLTETLSTESRDVIGFYDYRQLLEEIISEKKLQYGNAIKFNLILEKDSKVFIEPTQFLRILSNLINNAIESNATNPIIDIHTMLEKDRLCIIIKDNGSGIAPHILKKLGSEEITSKHKGNGIGFKDAVENIREWKGDILILKSDNTGTTIKIELLTEVEPVSQKDLVLIDDDELTRTTWAMKAKKSNINLKTYADIGSFKADIESINKDDILYIDSELGEVKGEELAIELRELGFTNLSIASGHPPERFSQYTFLRSVISKKAPF
jgi:signal transduction histidine kinase